MLGLTLRPPLLTYSNIEENFQHWVLIYVLWFCSDQIWVMALSVCFIFTVTIGAFPAVTVDVSSTVAGDTAWSESGFLLCLFQMKL